ncbi:dissimilatory sulfite reductase system component, protein DsrT [Candidatus Sulfopaludibacter sp. SbA6]|nr:dissimilatory sulfite reductase system component, protein DsrT [Candidatus Sulfopaludibacter sp. SbA6]
MQTKEAIAEQWLGRVLRTYPGQAAGFLATEHDAFRNPIGYTLKRGLAILLEELLLEMDASRVEAALDSIVQIRAVEDCAPGRALEFLFQLKPILSEHASGLDLDLLNARIDEMALLAFNLYMKYRERTFEARANEARRRVYVLERRMQPHEPADWQQRGAS